MLPWNGSTELSDEENQLYVDPETKPDPREVEESILEAVEKSRSVPLEGEWIPADETREDP